MLVVLGNFMSLIVKMLLGRRLMRYAGNRRAPSGIAP
jgi:hypothetical protein